MSMRLRILLEPRYGAAYEQILALARVIEDAGFDAFFCSDHYLGIDADDTSYRPTDSWLTLAGLARETSRVRLGMAPVELEDEQLRLIAERGAIDLPTALASLPPEQREMVIRRVVLDEPYRALAAEVRCSEQVVRKRVSRGLAALRANLGGER